MKHSSPHPINRLLLIPNKGSFFLFGPRMTGKSTWLKMNLDSALNIDLLEEANFQSYLGDPSRLYRELISYAQKSPKGWVVIDEIQRIPSLLNEVHRVLEQTSLRFALSGSSARKLKRGGANLLAGRAANLRLFSLTEQEMGEHFDLESSILWGGLPAVFTEDDFQRRKNILYSYVTTYLREEVQAEGLVRNLPAFSRFLQLATESIGQEISYTSISNETSVRSKTIKDYFEILEDTLIGFLLPPWKNTVRKQLAGSPKFYLFDNGVTNALRENLTDRPTGSVRGALFEQWVLQQIRALFSYRQYEGSFYFWRARGGNEIDLLIARGSKPVLAIEIKSTTRPTERDFAGLRSFAEEYPLVPRVLISQQSRSALFGKDHSYPFQEFFKLLWQGKWVR